MPARRGDRVRRTLGTEDARARVRSRRLRHTPDMACLRELLHVGSRALRPIRHRRRAALSPASHRAVHDKRPRRVRNARMTAAAELRDVASGLWIWRLEHPDWSPGLGWSPAVTSICVESGGEVVLLDPLAPREDASQLWER